MPIADPREMGSTHAAMIATLSGIDGYRRYFREAFGSEAITEANVAAALADYVRSRKSGNAPYDQWARWSHSWSRSMAKATRTRRRATFLARRAECEQEERSRT
jgi:cytochrome c peroxidase